MFENLLQNIVKRLLLVAGQFLMRIAYGERGFKARGILRGDGWSALGSFFWSLMLMAFLISTAVGIGVKPFSPVVLIVWVGIPVIYCFFALHHYYGICTFFGLGLLLSYGWIINPVGIISFVICLSSYLAERKSTESRKIIKRKWVWIFIWPIITTMFYVINGGLFVIITVAYKKRLDRIGQAFGLWTSLLRCPRTPGDGCPYSYNNVVVQ